MPYVGPDGSDVVTNPSSQQALNTVQLLPSNVKLGFGAFFTRRRNTGEFLISQASNSAAATDYVSNALYVGAFNEILLFATFTAASSGAATGLVLALQVSDGTGNFGGVTLANTFIDHPSGVFTIASPGNGPGCVGVGQWTNFGSLIRARTRWSAAWGSAQAIQIMIKGKG